MKRRPRAVSDIVQEASARGGGKRLGRELARVIERREVRARVAGRVAVAAERRGGSLPQRARGGDDGVRRARQHRSRRRPVVRDVSRGRRGLGPGARRRRASRRDDFGCRRDRDRRDAERPDGALGGDHSKRLGEQSRRLGERGRGRRDDDGVPRARSPIRAATMRLLLLLLLGVVVEALVGVQHREPRRGAFVRLLERLLRRPLVRAELRTPDPLPRPEPPTRRPRRRGEDVSTARERVVERVVERGVQEHGARRGDHRAHRFDPSARVAVLASAPVKLYALPRGGRP